MGNEMKLTEDEVKVLIYVKLLEDTDLPDCPNYTVGQKLEKYGNEPLGDMEGEYFNNALDKFCAFGLMEYDDINDMYELTELGKKKLKKLPLSNKLSDEAIKNIWNSTEWGEEFIKEHGMDIVSLVSGIVLP